MLQLRQGQLCPYRRRYTGHSEKAPAVLAREVPGLEILLADYT